MGGVIYFFLTTFSFSFAKHTLNCFLHRDKLFSIEDHFDDLWEGSLLGSVIRQQPFERIDWIDWLALIGIGAVFFVIVITTRKKPQLVEKTDAAYAVTFTKPSSSQDEIPFRLPPGFNIADFLMKMRDYYCQLQQKTKKTACNLFYVSPQLQEKLWSIVSEYQQFKGVQPPKDIRVVRASYNHYMAEVSVAFLHPTQMHNLYMREIWHLERDLLTPKSCWIIVDIECCMHELQYAQRTA